MFNWFGSSLFLFIFHYLIILLSWLFTPAHSFSLCTGVSYLISKIPYFCRRIRYFNMYTFIPYPNLPIYMIYSTWKDVMYHSKTKKRWKSEIQKDFHHYQARCVSTSWSVLQERRFDNFMGYWQGTSRMASKKWRGYLIPLRFLYHVLVCFKPFTTYRKSSLIK